MKQRFLTATVGIPVVLLVLLGAPIFAEAFTVLLGIGMIYEFLRLTGHDTLPAYAFLIAVLIFSILLAIRLPAQQMLMVNGAALALALIGRWVLQQPLWITLGPLYLALPLALLINLRLLDQGQKWIVVMLAATWITDSMALFGGKTFGRTKLAPTISPNKTREGTAIGVVSGCAAVLIAGAALKLLPDHQPTIIFATLLLPPLSVIGDLVESKIKRVYGKKDSGMFFPGHGGFLDRVDSVLFTTTGLWLLVTLFSL